MRWSDLIFWKRKKPKKIGNLEFEINGVKRGFRFGTYTIKLIGEQTGEKDILSIFTKIMKGDVDMLLAFYYCAARHYCEHNEIAIDFKEVNVSDWLDELGLEKVNELTAKLSNQYQLKNFQPPGPLGEN